MKTSFAHNNIERSVSRIWKKTFLNNVCKECTAAGFEVIKTSHSIVIGLAETDQIFLKSLKGNGGWLTRYDAKLFDEDAE